MGKRTHHELPCSHRERNMRVCWHLLITKRARQTIRSIIQLLLRVRVYGLHCPKLCSEIPLVSHVRGIKCSRRTRKISAFLHPRISFHSTLVGCTSGTGSGHLQVLNIIGSIELSGTAVRKTIMGNSRYTYYVFGGVQVLHLVG